MTCSELTRSSSRSNFSSSAEASRSQDAHTSRYSASASSSAIGRWSLSLILVRCI